ncbi:MAG: hypothetical protein SO414_07665, partial [Bacteroidaceae bacterium]|nr:hypothetical protein [Bacteroidaceae bacterium]
QPALQIAAKWSTKIVKPIASNQTQHEMMVSCHEMMISCHEMMVSWHEMTILYKISEQPISA